MLSAARVKIFRHGGSQAARLPRDFQLPGTEAIVSRTASGGVLLEPLSALEARRKSSSLWRDPAPSSLTWSRTRRPDARDE